MVFDRKTLVIPDKTSFEEQMIITHGDVIIGDRCLVEFGIKTDGRIFIGEHVIIDGTLNATGDIRADIFTNIGGDVTSKANVYLGEKVIINGKLSLKGDLDVGDSVEIKQGFEAKGWINIRSPIPIVIYIFIHLLELLKMGRSEEIERILEELEENDGRTIPISEIFFFIPPNSIIGIQKSKVECNIQIGAASKILGNFEVKGKVVLGNSSSLYGTIKSTGDTICGKYVRLEGNILSNSDVRIDEKTYVAGDVSGRKIYLSKNSSIEGTLQARQGISFIKPSETMMIEKVNRFENGMDIVDDVTELLE